jgi:catechol 2,3-dioxygenase-like lactoylglutathione lyase family enzyme
MNLQKTGTPVTYLYVADRDRALAFYREMFGLEVRSSDAFGDFIALNGALLRVTVMPDHKPGPHPVLGWDVDDIVSAVRELSKKGVAFSIFDGFGQDELGIWTAPDGDRLAFFADPDGNVLTLSQLVA